MAFRGLDPEEEVLRYKNHLPHWRQNGVTTFVTFRLRDSIPKEKLRTWESERQLWLESNGIGSESELTVEDLDDYIRQEYHRRFTAVFHGWLDTGHGACWLRRSECAGIVGGALRHFDTERYALEAFVVMPNHVHVLVTPLPEHDMPEILHSWKSFTSNEVNKLVRRSGTLWQKESYDHLVRNEEQFEHYRRYICNNPIKARLREDEFLWWDALGMPAM